MSTSAQIERLEALLSRIQRNAGLLSRERAGTAGQNGASSQTAAKQTVRAGRFESAPPKPATESVRSDAPEPSTLPPQQIESLAPEALDMQTIPPAEAFQSVAPEASEMQSIAPESSDELLQTLPPGDATLLATPIDSEAESSFSQGQQWDSVPAPTESDAPSDIELELTEDLADEQADEFSFTDEAPESSEKSKELEGLGASLGFATPGSDGMPSSIGEAVERAATDGPVRTPPPESGPQATIPPKGYDYAPELEEGDVPLSSLTGDVPTVSQLGTTVELESSEEAPEQLELLAPAGGQEEQPDEFEATLPGAEFGGGYNDSLSPPPNAREELAGYDRAQREREQRHSVSPAEHSQAPPAPSGQAPNETYARPAVDVTASPAVYEGERPRLAAVSFTQRLDASLELGRF